MVLELITDRGQTKNVCGRDRECVMTSIKDLWLHVQWKWMGVIGLGSKSMH